MELINNLNSIYSLAAAITTIVGFLYVTCFRKQKHTTSDEYKLIQDIRKKNRAWQTDKTDDNLVELAFSIHELVTYYNDNDVKARSDALCPFWKSFYQEHTHNAVHNVNSINLQVLLNNIVRNGSCSQKNLPRKKLW